MSTPPEDRPPLRIGTQEREAAYAALDTHLSAGRLDADEYGERYAKASMARTRPELDALFTDLPHPHPSYPPAFPEADRALFSGAPTNAPSWSGPRRPSFARAVAGLVAIVPVIALVLFFLSGAWIFFLVIPAVVSFAHGGRGWSYGGGGRRHGWAGGCGRRW